MKKARKEKSKSDQQKMTYNTGFSSISYREDNIPSLEHKDFIRYH